MTHNAGKKEARKGSKQSASPEITHEDEIKKHSSKGTIKRSE